MKERRERTDKLKNKAKIAKEILLNPLQTQREIAKKTKVWKSTANRVISDMGQNGTKDDRILGITDKDLEIVTLAQAEIHRRMWDAKELKKMRTYEIAQTAEKSERRYQIFRWDITNKEWWLDNIIIKWWE